MPRDGALPTLNRLESHQIHLSDASDGDGEDCPRHAQPQDPTALDPTAARRPSQQRPAAVTPRRTSPAAALSNQAISAAKRRTQQQQRDLQPAKALPYSATARPGTATRAAAAPGHRAAGDVGRPPKASAVDQQRRQRDPAVPWVTVLLVVVAATALTLYPGTLATAVLGGLRRVILPARSTVGLKRGGPTVSPSPTQRVAAAAAASASWVPAASRAGGLGSHGAGGGLSGAASAAVGTTWLRKAVSVRAWGMSKRAGSVAGSAGGGGGGGSSGRFRTGDAQLPAMAAAAAVGGGGSGDGTGPATPPPRAQGPDLEWRDSAKVRAITITSGGSSPYRTTWDELAAHSAQRLEWTDPSYQMLVVRQEQLGADKGTQEAFLAALQGGAQMVVGLDVTDPAAEAFLRDPRVTSKLPGIVLFAGGSERLSKDLTQLPGGLRPQDAGSWRTALARKLDWTPDGRGLAVWDTVQLLLGRHDSDNFLFVYLVLANQYVATVPQVADTTKGFDLGSLICMIKNCGSKVVGCVQDPTCKSALDCLNSCTFNDQVCQYRCIVSYESPLLEQFSLCILQLHNCRNLDAKPPLLPDPAPMAAFRGAPLTHEAAEDLFIGWLDQPGQGAPAGAHLGDRPGKQFSWLVAGGKNPAYDYFPCQHQLFYRGKGRGQVWYEPIFKAITLDGREVWRRRVYRVRRGKVPGTFHLSVLDNGVTSNEFWRILDCGDDLAFCLFYYSGAASTAGLSYSGAVLGTPDGNMPGPQHTARLHAALRRAGIEPWELSYVDNSDCGSAPLQITGPVPRPVAA